MAKKVPKRKHNTKKVLIKKLLKELIRKPRGKKSKLRNKTSKVVKKNEKQEPVSSDKNSKILRKLSRRAIQNRNLGYWKPMTWNAEVYQDLSVLLPQILIIIILISVYWHWSCLKYIWNIFHGTWFDIVLITIYINQASSHSCRWKFHRMIWSSDG